MKGRKVVRRSRLVQKRLNVRGHTISYRDEGRGSCMLLLHGYGGSPHDWEHLVPSLVKRHRVIVPNITPLFLDQSEKVRFRNQVEVLSEFLSRVLPEGEVANILAASYGGALAWALSIHDPRRIGRLILLSPMPPNPLSRIQFPDLRRLLWIGRWPQPLWLLFKTKWGRKLVPKLATHFNVAWLKKRADRFEILTPQKIRLVVHVMHRFSWILKSENWRFWEDRIRFIESPVCLIWGSEDRLYNEAEPERLQAVFPSCRLYRIHGAGHVIAKESPTQVESILEKFLESERKAA
jgi:pimeloyl-ACP methyl ester carboxylesterase